MQRSTLALLIGTTLLLCAGAVMVPRLLQDDEPSPLRWTEAEEVEVPVDAGVAIATAGADGVERTSVEASANDGVRAEARIDAILRGRVVDRFQRPVADAKVWLDFGRAGARGGPATRQRRVPDPVTTDAEGRFAFQGQAFRSLQVSLQVLHGNHAPGLFDKFLGEIQSEVDLGDLVLARGGELIGRVTDLEGNGIAGADLDLLPENNNRMRMLRDRGNLGLAFVTDANGYFRKANVAAGDWSISARAKRHTEGRSPTFASEDEQVVELEDIRLGPGYEVTGWVRDVQGQPIAKAEVRMRGDGRDRGGRGGGGPGREHRATTDAAGRFFLEHLPGTPMALDTTAEGFLQARLENLDPTAGQPVQVTMQDGLRVTGVALDTDGSPVTSFAVRAVRLRGLPLPGQTTDVADITADVADLAARLRDGTLDEASRQQLRSQFEDRRGGRGENGPGGQRPGQQTRDLGKPESHPNGEFLLTGLQEGVYAVHVQSPDHARFQSAELELRFGATSPHVIARLDGGVYVAGVVTTTTGSPIRGARVVMRTATLDGADEGARRRGRQGAADGFLRQLAGAATTLETTTDAEGEFVLKHATRGTYRLQADARGFANAATDPFELNADRSGIQMQLGPLGSLTGTVRGIAPTEIAEARVAAVPLSSQNGMAGMFGRGGGGQGGGPFNSTAVAADGTYRIDDLAPGDYVVRSWIGSPQDLMRELGPKFFDGSLAADVTVRGSEVAKLDLTVTRPLTGIVAGAVLHNGSPGAGMQVELSRQTEPGAAPTAPGNQGGPGGRGGRGGMFANAGRTFQTAVGASGQFRIENVPVGSYRLRLQAGRRGGVLHEETIEVVANATTERVLAVTTQSLQGSVTVDDGSDPGSLSGAVSLLPGISTLPENVAAWRRDNTTFDTRLQNGTFRFEAIKPGTYLLMVSVRGRERTTQPVVVGAGGATEIAVPAGKVRAADATAPGAATTPPRASGTRGG